MKYKADKIGRASKATDVLEETWTCLRKIDGRIPPAVLILLSASERGRLGHFLASSWRRPTKDLKAHDIALTPTLFSTKGKASHAEVLSTLVHEAAHAILYESIGDGGVTRGYYHRKEFRDTAIELGLDCSFHNTRYGWTITSWPSEGVPDQYRPAMTILKSLPLGAATSLKSGKARKRSTPKSGLLKLVCSCNPPRNLRACKSVTADGGITCSFCRADFEEAH